MSTSNAATYVLTSAGAVWAFGAGGSGELGSGGTADSFTTPVRVQFPAGVTIASLPDQSSMDTALAIDSTGHVWGWGKNGSGELCLGTTHKQLKPVELPLSGVTLATGGGGHGLYDASGTLYACGDNAAGELGDDGYFTNATTPMPVTGLPDEPITTVVSSYRGSGALLADGTYWDWGMNNLGQLGIGTKADGAVPVQVPLPASVTQVTQGGSSGINGQTLVVLSTGKVYGWGANDQGQLCGDTIASPVVSPTKIVPPVGVAWTKAASGGSTSYLIDAAGNLWACGRGSNGQIGQGTTKAKQVAPKDVLSGVTRVSGTGLGNAAALAG